MRLALLVLSCWALRRELAGVQTDRINEAIVERVNASGRAYLTHTRLRGRTMMRVGFGNVRTTEEHLGVLWSQVLAERDGLMKAAHLSAGAV